MDWWLIFAVFLYFACAILIVAEIFVPSGGLISICALACLVGGIVIFFQYSVTAGWIGIGVASVMITLTPPERKQGDAIPDTDKLKALLGAEGVVLTTLRPVGMCDFSGQRVECVAESGYVEESKKVKVINVESTQLTVRIIEES